MSSTVANLIRSFDSMSEVDQLEVLSEVIRRAPAQWPGDLHDDELVAMADELFQGLDAEEAAHADS